MFNYSIKLEAKELKALYSITSSDDLRKILQHVHFEVNQNNVVAVATNGHILCGINLTEKFEIDIDIPANISFNLPKIKIDKKTKFIELKGEMSNIHTIEVIESNNKGFKNKQTIRLYTKDKFPQWKRVVPDKYDFKPAILKAETVKFVYDFASKVNKFPRIYTNGNKAAFIKFDAFGETDQKYFGIVMPCNSQPLETIYPEQIKQPDFLNKF